MREDILDQKRGKFEIRNKKRKKNCTKLVQPEKRKRVYTIRIKVE